MGKYSIDYTEVYSKNYEVEANTFEEAKESMETIYKGYFDPDILEIFWMVEKRLQKGK